MLKETKILLSDFELGLLSNANWILTKDVIIQKTFELFAREVSWLKKYLTQSALDKLIPFGMPKISRGERYRDLPYVMLDYPANFGKEDIFVVRTMLWWGNEISVHLLLAGKYKREFEQRLRENLAKANSQFYICIAETPWEHHFEMTNYTTLQSLRNDELHTALAQPFVKIGLRYHLHQWNEMEDLLKEGYQQLFELLEA